MNKSIKWRLYMVFMIAWTVAVISACFIGIASKELITLQIILFVIAGVFTIGKAITSVHKPRGERILDTIQDLLIMNLMFGTVLNIPLLGLLGAIALLIMAFRSFITRRNDTKNTINNDEKIP